MADSSVNSYKSQQNDSFSDDNVNPNHSEKQQEYEHEIQILKPKDIKKIIREHLKIVEKLFKQKTNASIQMPEMNINQKEEYKYQKQISKERVCLKKNKQTINKIFQKIKQEKGFELRYILKKIKQIKYKHKEMAPIWKLIKYDVFIGGSSAIYYTYNEPKFEPDDLDIFIVTKFPIDCTKYSSLILKKIWEYLIEEIIQILNGIFEDVNPQKNKGVNYYEQMQSMHTFQEVLCKVKKTDSKKHKIQFIVTNKFEMDMIEANTKIGLDRIEVFHKNDYIVRFISQGKLTPAIITRIKKYEKYKHFKTIIIFNKYNKLLALCISLMIQPLQQIYYQDGQQSRLYRDIVSMAIENYVQIYFDDCVRQIFDRMKYGTYQYFQYFNNKYKRKILNGEQFQCLKKLSYQILKNQLIDYIIKLFDFQVTQKINLQDQQQKSDLEKKMKIVLEKFTIILAFLNYFIIENYQVQRVINSIFIYYFIKMLAYVQANQDSSNPSVEKIEKFIFPDELKEWANGLQNGTSNVKDLETIHVDIMDFYKKITKQKLDAFIDNDDFYKNKKKVQELNLWICGELNKKLELDDQFQFSNSKSDFSEFLEALWDNLYQYEKPSVIKKKLQKIKEPRLFDYYKKESQNQNPNQQFDQNAENQQIFQPILNGISSDNQEASSQESGQNDQYQEQILQIQQVSQENYIQGQGQQIDQESPKFYIYEIQDEQKETEFNSNT